MAGSLAPGRRRRGARVVFAVVAVLLVGPGAAPRAGGAAVAAPAETTVPLPRPCDAAPETYDPCESSGTASLMHTLFNLDVEEQGSDTLVCNFVGEAVLSMDGGQWNITYVGQNWHTVAGTAFECGGGTGGNSMVSGTYEIDPLRIVVSGPGDCPNDRVDFDGTVISGTTHAFCGESDVYTFSVTLAPPPPADSVPGAEALSGPTGSTVPASVAVAPDAIGTAGSTTGSPAQAAAATESGEGGGDRMTAAILIAAALVCAIIAAILARSLRSPPELSPPAGTEPDGVDKVEQDEQDEEDEDQEVLLELTHPAGQSPLVFTTGWLFGAHAVADPHGPDRTDISHRVHWSGSGTFQPAVGNQSRPAFASEGLNTIELAVTHQGQTTTRSYTVDAVDPHLYAYVGCNAAAPADSHGGCPACPHPVVGPIITGSPTVLINGKPAARFGDRGTHAACCGANEFEIPYQPTLEPRVLIDGRPGAKLGDETQHCGGMGTIIVAAP